MDIVVLNECFFNKTHIARLRKLGKVVVFTDTTTNEQALARSKGASIIIADQFVVPLNGLITESSSLKLIALNSTSFSTIDLATAQRRKIKVANVPGFSKQAVAELAVGLMFAVNRKISLGDALVREHATELDPGNAEHQKFVGFDMKGKTLGVIGLGKIGTVVAELGRALGMQVIAYNRSPRKIPGVTMAPLDAVLRKSDIVSVNLLLSKETTNFLGKKELGKMKSSAILINVSPPKLIDQKVLAEMLATGKLAGAGIDMFGAQKDDPLLKLKNVVLTPHCGSFTKEAFFENLPNMIISNVEAFVKGKPQNIVS